MKVDDGHGGTVDTPNGNSVTDKKNEKDFNGRGAEDKRAEPTVVKAPINKKMRKFLISDKMIELLNNQLQDELINHNLYCTFALFYQSRGLFKLEDYFMKRADEEMLHHKWIFGYLAYCGVPLQYPEIPAINIDEVRDLIEPFKMTQDKEIETTQTINEIAKQCLAEGDFGTLAWLNGTGAVEGKLIPEQTEEMSISNDVYEIACIEGSWLTREKRILEYYNSKR